MSIVSIPFSGSKKYSVKRVNEIVKAGGYRTVYEVFGGSCVLSVNLFNEGIVDRAVINDFDGLFDIYPEYLDYKDWLVKECLKSGIKKTYRAGTCGGKYERGYSYQYSDSGEIVKVDRLKLNEQDQNTLQNLVKQIPKKYWKLLATGSNFTYQNCSLFNDIRLSNFSYFMNYLKTDKQRNYLNIIQKLERVQLDYRDFLSRYKDDFSRDTILIIDPPYIGTTQNQYRTQFDEIQTIQLLKTLETLRTDFIFFNHNPTKVKEWLKEANLNYELFELIGNKQNSANHSRLDVMVYVKF